MTTARRFLWRWPHWWAIALCVGAWGCVAARWWGSHPAHGVALLDWTLMIVAMMLPLVFVHLRVAAARSLWPRRQRAMIGFLFGYVAISLLAGLGFFALIGAMGFVNAGAGAPRAAAAAFVLAAVWQLSPAKRRALVACHRTMPLTPRGWTADRDCVRYGWTIGRNCLVSCAGLMLACVVAGHSLPAMMAVTAMAGAERISARAGARITSTALALIAALQFAASRSSGAG